LARIGPGKKLRASLIAQSAGGGERHVGYFLPTSIFCFSRNR